MSEGDRGWGSGVRSPGVGQEPGTHGGEGQVSLPSPGPRTIPYAIPLTLLGLMVFAVVALAKLPPSEVRLSGFTTRLQGRTASQRHNAELAARTLNGAVVAPRASFSFNKRVQSWSQDRGYVKAPVSYDGELLPAFGGGVCQTSTTFYNAALLAGMDITERHHHVFAPHYVPPGRDAAVAYPSIDLRLVNPHLFPVRIRARAEGDRLTVELWGKKSLTTQYAIASNVFSAEPPPRQRFQVTADSKTPGFRRRTGNAGFRVVTYRVIEEAGKPARRERLSDDSYPALPEAVRFAE